MCDTYTTLSLGCTDKLRDRLPSLEKAKKLQPLVAERQKLINDLKEAQAKGALTPAEYAAQHASCDPFSCAPCLARPALACFDCVCAPSASARHWCVPACLTARWRALPLQTPLRWQGFSRNTKRWPAFRRNDPRRAAGCGL